VGGPSVGDHDDVVRETFDAEYYRRFYRDDPVHDRRRIARLAEGVSGLCGWWGLPLRSVLDVGAGPGYWRDWFAQQRPTVRYRSIDVSPYACEKYGHELRDIATWEPPGRYDLVVCQGVLQYLSDVRAALAIEHIGVATRGVLYLEVPTARDRVEVIDAASTDLDIRWRSGGWYLRHLSPHVVKVGAGLFVSRHAPVRFYELERA
jgi:SAM-dependent methyltransferase